MGRLCDTRPLSTVKPSLYEASCKLDDSRLDMVGLLIFFRHLNSTAFGILDCSDALIGRMPCFAPHHPIISLTFTASGWWMSNSVQPHNPSLAVPYIKMYGLDVGPVSTSHFYTSLIIQYPKKRSPDCYSLLALQCEHAKFEPCAWIPGCRRRIISGIDRCGPSFSSCQHL